MPLLVDLQPAGEFLMEDLFRAGGLLAVLAEVQDLLDPTAITVTGKPLVDALDGAEVWDPTVIRPRTDPLLWTPGSPYCEAIWRPTVPSSSRLRQRQRCCSTAAGQSCSTASRTFMPASTIPTSTSMPTRC